MILRRQPDGNQLQRPCAEVPSDRFDTLHRNLVWVLSRVVAAPRTRTSDKGDPVKFRIRKASGGYRVHIQAANGKTVFWTEVYASKQSAKHAAEIVKAQAHAAPIVDDTI